MGRARKTAQASVLAIGKALLWLLVFVAWLAVGLVLHANVPALRSAFGTALNRGLAGDFRGKVVLGGFESIGASGARLGELQVLDEHGELVLSLQGVRVHYNAWSIGKSLLWPGAGPLRVDHVRVDRSRLMLVTDPQTGEWTLARALSKLKPPGPPKDRAPLTYAFTTVELGDVTVLLDHPVLGKVEAHVQQVRGSAEVGGEDTEVSVQRFGVRLQTSSGDLTLDGTGSLRLLRKGFIAATFHGFVDGTELDAGVQFEADVLSATIAVPHALPERMRDLWAAWPISVPVAATLNARGPLDALAITARVTAGDSSLELAGDVRLTTPARARLSAIAHALDARLIWPGAPMTALEARAEIQVDPAPAGVTVLIDAKTDATLIEATPVPAADLSLRIDAGETKAHYRLGDARAELEGDVLFARDGAIQLSARASRVNLGRFPELGGQVKGRVDLHAQAELRDEKISGTLGGRLSELAIGPASIEAGHIDVKFAGPVADLDAVDLRTSLTGTGIQIGPQRFERGQVTSQGVWQNSELDAQLSGSDGAHGSGRGKLDVRTGLALRDLDVTWSQPALTLTAHVSEWAPERGVLRAEEIKLSGKVGTLDGSAQILPGHLELVITADSLDTKLLARSLGIDSRRLTGVVTGHGQLSRAADRAQGKLDLRVEGFGLLDLSLGELGVHASLVDRQLEAKLDAADSALGRLRAEASVELAGPVLDLAAWRGATGAGSAAVEQIPLWPVGLLLSKNGMVKELDGRADVALQVERKDRAALPNVFVQAGTHELRFALPSEQSGEPDKTYESYAVHASASIDGGSGHGEATVLVTDEHGSLVTTSGSLDVDLPALLSEPRAILARLFATPLDALVRLHARPLSLLPPPFDVRDLAGSVEGTLQLRGSLAEPSLALALSGHELLGSLSDAGRAVDITSVVHYTPNSGELLGYADVVQAGKSLVAARLTGSLPNPLETTPSWAALELQAAAMLNGVPLELWPAAAREELAARLYGSVDIEKHGLEVRQRAHLEIADLSARGHVLGNGRLTFETEREQVQAELRIGSNAHHLRARLRTATRGADEKSAPIEGSLTAHDFDAAALSPLTSGILTHVGGSVDADLSFTLRPTKADWYLGINGKAALKNGSAHVDLLGLEVREIAAKLTSRSTPEYTVIQIAPLEAKARSRSPNLRGDAELWLEGSRVINGEANLSLTEVPLSLKGASRGTARGSIKARLERKPDHMLLEVKVPTLRIKLPASSTRTLIALEENPELDVLQAIPETVEVAHDPLLWKMVFLLGDGVRLQRGDLDVPLTGKPIIEYQREVRPSGTIEARPGGHITLFDQVFSIDRGVIQFVPDEPDNPRIDITASWRAPDGTTVYVDITGSAEHANILTRDDRGLQEVERFYLITGSSGSVNSGDSRPMADGGAAETGALGQTFALGINEVLRDSLGNVAVSVGTTADDRQSYGASVRLSEKLSFQGSFQPASESNLEESNNDLTGTLDYRFSRRWSLRTELGTSGGAFDLLWSHRY